MKCSTIALAVLALLAAALFAPNPAFRLIGTGNKPGLLDLYAAQKDKAPSAIEIGEHMKNYHERNVGEAKNVKEENPSMINSFYNVVTDMYEYGWGQSFHFAHTRTTESHDDSIRRHEERLAQELGLKPGMVAVDVGSGIGGPARAIATFSGANIVGITINEYQVAKGNEYSRTMGLDKLVNLVQGNFLAMPFANETYDAAYAMEATCHAPTLEDVYSEVFRVLKPGALFASFEWLKTPAYDAGNPEHVRIAQEIEYGNALPPLRNLADVKKAAKTVGFEWVSDVDLAEDRVGTRPWWARLTYTKLSRYATHVVTWITEKLGLAPAGTHAVHGVLLVAADGLIEGGETATFTPMHLCVMRKPLA